MIHMYIILRNILKKVWLIIWILMFILVLPIYIIIMIILNFTLCDDYKKFKQNFNEDVTMVFKNLTEHIKKI